MSNYLSRLVNRSFNPIDTVQPRLPVRFEPRLNELGQSVAPIPEMVEQSILDRNLDIAQPIPPSTRSTTTTPPTNAGVQQPNRDHSIPPILPSVPDVRVPAVAPTNAQFTAAIQPNLPALDRTTPDQLTPAQVLSPSAIPGVQVLESVSVRETIVEVDQSISPTSDQAKMVAELPQSSSQVIQPAIAPFAQVERTAIAPDLTPTQPTIQVKIGRVEVRAIPSPPSVRPVTRSATPPKLSLAAYLKARQGSER